MPKSFLALGRKLSQQDEQPRLQLLQLQNFIPVASINFYSIGTTIIAQHQQSMLYGSSQAWSEEKIREISLSVHLIKAFQHVWNLPVEKISTVMRRVKAPHCMFVMGKFLLNLTHVINITRFIIHCFLRNYTRRKNIYFFLILFIYFLRIPEIWVVIHY